MFSLGARCIENTSLRRGAGGDWHLYAEIHNETDVQATEFIVLGTLLDAEGNPGQAPICPHELSPSSFSAYDIRFPGTEGLPEPASYKVNVLSGKTLESI